MSWLSRAWDHNRNFIGNAVKNVSPLLAFTPLGPLGAGVAGALGRSVQKGANLGSIVKSGVSNAAIGAGAHSAYGLARGALGGGGSAAGEVAGAANPSLVSDGNGGWLSTGGQAGGSAGPAGFAAGAAGASPAPPSLSSRLMGGLQDAGTFAKNNAAVLGQIGSGVLNAREQGQSNDLKTQEMDFERKQYEDEQARRKRIAELLGPLYQQMLTSRQGMAANPYASPGS